MIDRKNDSVLSRLQEAQDTIDNLKGTQPIGADNTEVLLISTLDTYDSISGTVANNARIKFTMYFGPTNIKDWQESTYTQLAYQVYVGNPSDTVLAPYDGSLINVLPDIRLEAYTAQSQIQVVNTSGVNKKFAIKVFALTTALEGTINASWIPV